MAHIVFLLDSAVPELSLLPFFFFSFVTWTFSNNLSQLSVEWPVIWILLFSFDWIWVTLSDRDRNTTYLGWPLSSWCRSVSLLGLRSPITWLQQHAADLPDARALLPLCNRQATSGVILRGRANVPLPRPSTRRFWHPAAPSASINYNGGGCKHHRCLSIWTQWLG